MNEMIRLNGEWRFGMDPDREGWKQHWFAKVLPLSIALPGTMEENGYGTAPDDVNIKNLNHTFKYSGMAWYQKEIEIPESWSGKQLVLFLERCQWESHIWLDNDYIGMQNSLSTPHVYTLKTTATPGKHMLTMMIDNSNLNYAGESPSADTDEDRAKDELGRDINIHLTTKISTGKKINCGIHDLTYAWNGIIGRMELQGIDPVWIEQVDIYPDIHHKQAHVKVQIGNLTNVPVDGMVAVECRVDGSGDLKRSSYPLTIPSDEQSVFEFVFDMGEDVKLWSLHAPHLYTMELKLDTTPQNDQVAACSHKRSVTFGMRQLTTDGTQFVLNGQKIFLRGTLEGCAFPLTGYPPADVTWWEGVFGVMKDYGLNHMRMHTICPPEAMFIAADRIGIVIQAELPGTSCPSKDEAMEVEQYLSLELERILKAYGNHPSMMLVSMGNEQLVVGDSGFLARHQEVLRRKVAYGKQTDPRHLYTSTSHPITPGRIDDFYVTATYLNIKENVTDTDDSTTSVVVGKLGKPLNGILWGGPNPLTASRFCTYAPDTMVDFSNEIKQIDRPVITHEVGQWAVYPNLREIEKYTGVLKARNFEHIRDDLISKGLIDLADDYVQASGQLSLRLYKEEIESALRTSGLAGFQLLDLHDYPAQGTSTVGILDVFWDSKGLITPQAFRGFCSDTVPLLRMEKYTWTNDEIFKADIDVAHYGAEDIRDATLTWALTDEHGQVMKEGALEKVDIPTGDVRRIGTIHTNLQEVTEFHKLNVRVGIRGTEVQNSWELWVYPAALPEITASDVAILEQLGEEGLTALHDGGKVLLVLKPGTLQHALPGVFTTVFWNVLMKEQVGTMGLLCDPSHPVFDEFPTDFHTNWQWWDLVMRSSAICLDHTSQAFRPIVQVIDAFHENKKLGLLFEAVVGKGKLLVCSADIVSDLETRPVARQLRHSILKYMNSSKFKPAYRMEPPELK